MEFKTACPRLVDLKVISLPLMAAWMASVLPVPWVTQIVSSMRDSRSNPTLMTLSRSSVSHSRVRSKKHPRILAHRSLGLQTVRKGLQCSPRPAINERILECADSNKGDPHHTKEPPHGLHIWVIDEDIASEHLRRRPALTV